MVMAWIWTGMVTIAWIAGSLTGQMGAVSSAAMEGAAAAVELCVKLCGPLCLWSGVMEVMRRGGLLAKLTGLLRPLLRRLLPHACADRETEEALCANLSANMLGLGNAATPMGIRAAQRMARGCNGTAGDELCRLVVLNTASVQLLPTTAASLRAACGAAAPFDILPCVWLSSVFSVAVGLGTAKVLGKVWRT